MWEDPNFQDVQTRVREQLRKVCNASLSAEERDNAKNLLILELVARFRSKILKSTQKRVGIADRNTELENSAFIYLKERATKMAEEIELQNLPLAHVVSKWINSWAVDKIRRSDGNSLKRGKNRKKCAITDVNASYADDCQPLALIVSQETNEQIRAAIAAAVSHLDDIERAVILSYFGLDQSEDLPLREVANALGVPLSVATNALRRAKRKVKAWISEVDIPNMLGVM